MILIINFLKRKVTLLILLLFAAQFIYAQQTNYSYFKLMVVNEKDEILLVNFQDKWEPAGKKYTSGETIRETLEMMAGEMGVEIGDIKLRALITKYYGESENPIIFNYIEAKYVSGKITVPPGCKDIKWFTRREALEIIPFEAMKMILTKVFNGPEDQLWGGAVRIKKEEVDIIEEFYEF